MAEGIAVGAFGRGEDAGEEGFALSGDGAGDAFGFDEVDAGDRARHGSGFVFRGW